MIVIPAQYAREGRPNRGIESSLKNLISLHVDSPLRVFKIFSPSLSGSYFFPNLFLRISSSVGLPISCSS
jgi:hypothetical protein